MFQRLRTRVLLIGAAALVAAPFGLPGASAAPVAAPAGFEPVVAEIAAHGLGQQSGLDRATAMGRLASQAVRVSLGERLVDQLGAKAAGMWLDQQSGTVVVNVVDEQAAAQVHSAGAKAQVVSRTMAQLESVRDQLLAGQPADTSVGIDVRTNQVVVQVGKAAAAGGLTTAAGRFGSAVRVEHIDGSFDMLMSGGDPIVASNGGRCSLGFNTTGNTGVTAGHCTASIGQWYDGWTGQYYGPSIATSFPGNDFGLIRNDGGLPQTGAVYLYNGGYQDITAVLNPYYGLYVCKSGSTSGVTCGYVYATGVTICLTSGGGGGWTYFQPVAEALNAWGVWIF
jgi:streptogrisin D